MIRYLLKDDVYYSLNDITKWLTQEQLLTQDQRRSFEFSCRAYITSQLAIAYERKRVYQHQEPIVLPVQDYFIHWILWANLLLLLPESTGGHRKVDTLNLLLGNPETVYLRSEFKYDIKLVCLNDYVNASVYYN